MRIHVAGRSFIGRLMAFVVATMLLILGFMFSLIVLVVLLAGVLLAVAYFHWKTRHLRKAMREQRTQAATGDIIEGEAVVVENDRVRARTFLPDEPSDRDRP